MEADWLTELQKNSESLWENALRQTPSSELVGAIGRS
jgi:hypothetical protein